MPQDTSAPLAKKPFSLSLSNSNTAPKKTSFNLSSSSSTPSSRDQRAGQSLPRRPHQLHHDDSGDEADDAPTDEVVTGFDTHTGAVIDADGSEISAEKQRLVIPVASQNNWRDRPGVNRQPRGKKNLLPKEVQAIREAAAKGDPTATGGGNAEVEGPSMAYGISYAQPSQGGGGDDDDGAKPMKDADVEAGAETEGRKAPRTEDEIALQALIRESNGEAQGGSDLVIESGKRDDELGDLEGEDSGVRYDETGSFRADVQVRPDPATLDQYNAIPVEEFGAALLRGMGWKDGQAIGRGNYGTSATADGAIRPRIPERRPGFLGIGAKDVSGGKGAEMELGAWGKSAMRKGSRKAGGDGKGGGGNTEGVYTPVLMRNKQTGDYITEEDLAVAQKQAKKNDGDDEWKERRDRNLEKSGRDRDRDRDREYRKRDYDDDDESDRYDRRKTGSSRRDRSLSGDRHSRRRRYEDEDGKRRDDRYYRDKERDRERQRGRDKGRDRDRDREPDRSHRYRDDDRHSSRHSSSHTSSRHGRDRDRESESDSYRRRR